MGRAHLTERVMQILRDMKKSKPNTNVQNSPITVTERAPRKRKFVPASRNYTQTSGKHADPRAVCHSVYNFLQNSGLIVTSGKDIRFGRSRSYKMNDSGSEKMYYTKNRHNSYLILTHLVPLMERGTMIYFGPPGTGKTTAPELVSHFLFGLPPKKVQEGAIYGNPELTLTDMVATVKIGTLLKTGKEIVKAREFMKSMIRIIDEVLSAGDESLLKPEYLRAL